jgi:hypothetical protein
MMPEIPTPAGSPVVLLHQQEPVGTSPTERHLAVRALLGACLLGTLQHHGRGDHEVTGGTSREDVRLIGLRRVVIRGDDGLHGCAFEYAVHEAVNRAGGIPEPVASAVASVVSAEVGALYTELGVPFTAWSPGVRSVMFAVEKQHDDPERLRVRAQLGDGALIWAGAGPEPYLLGEVLPSCAIPSRYRHGRRRATGRALPALPPALSQVWRTDLFLGGATVDRTPAVADLVGSAEPTAWISATVKYRARQVVGGPGLHLGLESGFVYGRRHPLETTRSRRAGLRVLTLPVDGEFMEAFNRAWRVLVQVLVFGAPRYAHPARIAPEDFALAEELGRRRREFVVDVAHDLLHSGQSGVAAQVVRPGNPAASAGRTPLVVPVPRVRRAA